MGRTLISLIYTDWLWVRCIGRIIFSIATHYMCYAVFLSSVVPVPIVAAVIYIVKKKCKTKKCKYILKLQHTSYSAT